MTPDRMVTTLIGGRCARPDVTSISRMKPSPDGYSQRLELVELAVEFQHRLGDRLVGVVAEEPAGDAAEHRGDGGDQRVAIGAVGPRQRHRQEQHVGRHEEDRAFDEGDEGQPPFGGFARGERQGPVVESAKHRHPRWTVPACLGRFCAVHNGRFGRRPGPAARRRRAAGRIRREYVDEAMPLRIVPSRSARSRVVPLWWNW